MKLLLEEYEGIRRWMYRNARPLDLARWRFHFEGAGLRRYWKRCPPIRMRMGASAMPWKRTRGIRIPRPSRPLRR